MTLNLALTSRHSIYLTGDFRLTYNGERTKDDLLTQKIVPIANFGWCALVAFCGVAKTRSIDVGDWIENQVHASSPEDSIMDFVTRLKTADHWLSKVSGKRQLNITIAGYQGRRPFLILLSNYQDMDGNSHPNTLPHLEIYKLKPKKPEVRIFGDTSGVTHSDKATLMRLLLQDQPVKTRTALVDVNTSASGRVKSISPEFVSGHLSPTGHGTIIPHGIDENVEYMPRFVIRSFEMMGAVGLELKTDEHGNVLKPGWIQMGLRVSAGNDKHIGFAAVNEYRNVVKPILAGEQCNTRVFWKIASK